MHVLIIPVDPFMSPERPLSGIFQNDQAIALIKTGYRVGVLSIALYNPLVLIKKFLLNQAIFTDSPNKFPYPVRRKAVGVYTPFFRQGYNWQFVQSGLNLFERYLKIYGRPDIVHAHNALRAGILAKAIKNKFNIPYVITEHSSAFARNKIHASDRPYIAEAYRKANKCLAVSPSFAILLESFFPDPKKSWEIVGNILDGRLEEENKTYDFFSDKGNRFKFLNVSSLVPLKGQEDLLEAFAASFRNNKRVELGIIGAGPLNEKLTLLTRELGISDQVTFYGRIDRKEVFQHLMITDVYIHPSHYETFGVSIIEALACGKPVIATKCGGPEYIINQSNGILVEKNNTKSIGKAMKSIMSANDTYDNQLIRKNCIERFGRQAITKRLTKIYSEAVQSYC